MKSNDKVVSQKLTSLYIILSAFFLGNALLAEFVGVKIFSVGHALGFPETSFVNKINMSIGVIIWPMVFITSDILNEYFGKSGVKRISFITAGTIVYSSIIVLIGTKLPPAKFWLENNQAYAIGNSFDINLAYHIIFRQGIGIVVGSVSAFLLSQLIDVYVFHYLRRIAEHKYLWLRATGSTVVSQLFDSFLILFVAFFLMGNWSLKQVFDVGLVQYLYKIGLAIILTPLIYLVHNFIDRYLGKELSEKIVIEADKGW